MPPPSDDTAAACPKCYEVLPANTRFCTHCGSGVDDDEELAQPGTSHACPHCGEPAEPGSVFCGSCGRRTETTRISPHPAAPDMITGAMQMGPTASMGSLANALPDGTRGRTYPLALAGPTTVGRTEGDITFPEDRYQSPHHLTLEGDGQQLVARDVGSLNGTYLRIREHALLPAGAMVIVGRQVLRLAKVAPAPPRVHEDGTVLCGSEARVAAWAVGQIMMSGGVREIHAISPPGLTLGRAGCDVNFPLDSFISTQHVRLEPVDDAVRVTDLKSSNGTWVRITRPIPVQHGQQLLVGKVRLTVLLPQP